jgi:hypothetical protein
MDAQQRSQAEVESYLAMIRKTIADSERLVSQAELRIAETDRLLAQQGLTREQVLAMDVSSSQIDAANAELRRRGLPELDDGGWDSAADLGGTPAAHAMQEGTADEVDARREKFGMMMKPFRI